MEVAMKKRYSIVKEQNPQRETTAKRFSSTADSLSPGERAVLTIFRRINLDIERDAGYYAPGFSIRGLHLEQFPIFPG
jgi:hypothetical protein